MVLTAGFGTRLRPLTKSIPKPLLPVANRPLLEYSLALLAAAGVKESLINSHHLAERMQDGLRGIDTSGLRIHASFEPKIMGTAGGVKKVATFLAEEGTFLLLNGDFLIDIDLREVVDFHLKKGARATMILREDKRNGGISVDKNGQIRRFLEPVQAESPGWIRTMFTGIHVLEPEVLKLIPSNTPWEINRQVYPEMLRRGWPVFGFIHHGYWREAGDTAGYLAANLEVVSGRAGSILPRPGSGCLTLAGKKCLPPVLMGTGVELGPGVKLGPEAVIGKESRIGGHAEVRRAVILEGTDVPGGITIDGEVWFPEGRVSVTPPVE